MKLTHPTNLANFSRLQTDDMTVYFSYETPIAVIKNFEAPLISNNEWRQTTGKHINYVKAHTFDYKQVPHELIMASLNTH